MKLDWNINDVRSQVSYNNTVLSDAMLCIVGMETTPRTGTVINQLAEWFTSIG